MRVIRWHFAYVVFSISRLEARCTVADGVRSETVEKSPLHSLAWEFNSRTPAAETDPLCWHQRVQVGVVPAMQSDGAEHGFGPV